MLPRIAIIGTGPTGLYTFKQVIASTVPLSITLYEAEGEPGKGTPYHPDMNDPAMLSNIPSIELPAFTETLAELNLPMGKLGPAIRIAITGSTASPSIDHTVYLCGRETALERLRSALVKLPS